MNSVLNNKLLVITVQKEYQLSSLKSPCKVWKYVFFIHLLFVMTWKVILEIFEKKNFLEKKLTAIQFSNIQISRQFSNKSWNFLIIKYFTIQYKNIIFLTPMQRFNKGHTISIKNIISDVPFQCFSISKIFRTVVTSLRWQKCFEKSFLNMLNFKNKPM